MKKVGTIRPRPFRELRAKYVKPWTFMRGCGCCGTALWDADAGADERGLWHNGWWYCSRECLDLVLNLGGVG